MLSFLSLSLSLSSCCTHLIMLDLFEEMIPHISLKNCFPEYDGPDGEYMCTYTYTPTFTHHVFDVIRLYTR